MPKKVKKMKQDKDYDDDIDLTSSDSSCEYKETVDENRKLRQEILSLKHTVLNMEKKYKAVIDELNYIKSKKEDKTNLVEDDVMRPDIQNVADEFPALPGPSPIIQQRSIKSQKIPKSKIGSRNSSPPIIMDMGNINVHKLTQILVSTVGNAFSISIKTDRVVIHTSDIKVREAIINNIKDYDFYTYSTSDSKPHNLLIKGLPNYYPEDQIRNSIVEKLPEIKIISLKKFEVPKRFIKNNSKRYDNLKIWQLIIEPVNDVNKILDVNNLLNINIKIEKFNNTEITQCKNCQQYGHVAINCNRPRICVRCALHHEIGNCKLPQPVFDNNGVQHPETIPTCVNCGLKGHPSNYRCDFYKNLIQKIKKKPDMPKMNSTIYINPTPGTTPQTPNNASYANVVKNNRNNPMLSDLVKYFKIAESIKHEYNSLNTIPEKQALLMKTVLEITLNNYNG